MNKYGDVAVRAITLLQSGACSSPVDAWDSAAKEVFPNSESSQEKGCPRSTFLGLCEHGVVQGVPIGRYTESELNKGYAIRAVELLRNDPKLATLEPRALWEHLMAGEDKKYNSQMDVVLALWEKGAVS